VGITRLKPRSPRRIVHVPFSLLPRPSRSSPADSRASSGATSVPCAERRHPASVAITCRSGVTPSPEKLPSAVAWLRFAPPLMRPSTPILRAAMPGRVTLPGQIPARRHAAIAQRHLGMARQSARAAHAGGQMRRRQIEDRLAARQIGVARHRWRRAPGRDAGSSDCNAAR
jgi:hypothetical protein